MRACHCAFGREKIAESFEKNPNIWDELLNSFAGYFVLPILLKLSMMMCMGDPKKHHLDGATLHN